MSISLNHTHLYLQAVKLKLATPLSRFQVGLRARPLKAHYLVKISFLVGIFLKFG
jgi:hypothetical protein